MKRGEEAQLNVFQYGGSTSDMKQYAKYLENNVSVAIRYYLLMLASILEIL